jgi:hypothetical protein
MIGEDKDRQRIQDEERIKEIADDIQVAYRALGTETPGIFTGVGLGTSPKLLSDWLDEKQLRSRLGFPNESQSTSEIDGVE